MRRKIQVRVYFIFFLSMISFSTLSQCIDKIQSFAIGERVDYEVYYNWGFIWVNAGEVLFKVDSKMQNGQKVFHFISEGISKPSYDWLYKVRDKYESKVIYNTFQPIWFKRDTFEGKFKVDEEYHYLPEQNLVALSKSDSNTPLVKDTLKVPPCTFDVLTTVYYARTIDFAQYKVGEKIPIDVIMDGEVHHLYIRYLGKEVIEARDGRKYACIKFKPLLVAGSIFEGGEDMTVWVTDDDNKIPILVEAKILVGSIKAYFTKATGVRNPQTALIE